MLSERRSPFDVPASELEGLIDRGASPFPELQNARADLERLLHQPHGEALVAEAGTLLDGVEWIPQTTYSRHRAFARRGLREPYEDPYFLKRHRLNALVTQLLLGRDQYKETIEDYLWDICEETTWVIPAHGRLIDLMAAETALWLAEAVYLVGDALDGDVRRRVRREIDDRILTPFLEKHFDLSWFNGGDNWNGVCSGAIGGAFLYLEQDLQRLTHALTLILESLGTYLVAAFEADGGTTEGVGYWQYGLNNVVIFAEMLRACSEGAIDLLADPRFRQIATFPAKMLLPNDRFASFSDCPTEVPISPGIIARLAERTDDPSLLSLLSAGATLYHEAGGPRGLRNLLWWDGQQYRGDPAPDDMLPATGIARLTATTRAGAPIVLMVKAGHNGENHNHNDVGSFILNVEGENVLTDPGPGRIDRDYFRDETRYNNLFANSEGHGVPVIDGSAQGTGRSFTGELHGIDYDEEGGQKSVMVELAGAYPVSGLEQATRRLTIDVRTGCICLHDSFHFTDANHGIEDVLVTWLPVTVDGGTAMIRGQHHDLHMTIEAPSGAAFELESLADESHANRKREVLQRLRVTSTGMTSQVRLRLDIRAPER